MAFTRGGIPSGRIELEYIPLEEEIKKMAKLNFTSSWWNIPL